MKLGFFNFRYCVIQPTATLHPRLECIPGFHPRKKTSW